MPLDSLRLLAPGSSGKKSLSKVTGAGLPSTVACGAAMSMTTALDAVTALSICTNSPVPMFVSRSADVLPPGLTVTVG